MSPVKAEDTEKTAQDFERASDQNLLRYLKSQNTDANQFKFMNEMSKKVKTPSDSLREALNRLRNTKKEMHSSEDPNDKYSFCSFTVQEVLDMDNIIRKEYGMRKLSCYTIRLDEYNPANREAHWKRIIGAKKIAYPHKLPYVIAEFEECEGVDPATADNQDEINDLVHDFLIANWPMTESYTKQQIGLAKDAVVQKMKINIMGELPEKQAAPVIKEKGKKE